MMTVSGDGLLAFKWFQGDGFSTTFDFKFYFLVNEDLKFLLERPDVTLASVTPNQITGAGDPNGGSFTLDTAPLATERIGVFRDLSLGQPTDVEAQEDIPPAAIQVALDRLAMVDIQQQDGIDRAIRLSDSDAPGDIRLPVQAERAGRYLAFDQNGDPIARENVDISVAEVATPQEASTGAGDGLITAALLPAAVQALSPPPPPLSVAGQADAVAGERDDVLMTPLSSKQANEAQRALAPSQRCKRLMNRWQPGAISYAANYFIMEDGTVRAAGTNAHYDMAQGDVVYTQTLPGHVSTPHGLDGVPDQVCAAYGSYAIVTDTGDVCMWGYNTHGQLGDGSTTLRRTPVLIDPVIGPRSGDPGKKVVKLIHNSTHSYTANSWYALCEDGTAWAWGYNAYGQLARGDTLNSSTPVQMKDATGAEIENAVDIAAGAGQYGHVLVLTADNEVLAAGYGNVHQTGQPTTSNLLLLTPCFNLPVGAVRKIIGGGGQNTSVSGVLMEDGRLYMAGYNSQGALGQGDTAVKVSFQQVTAEIGSDVDDFWILGGNYPSIFASLSDGRFFGWGNGNVGGLGHGASGNINVPVQITVGGDDTPEIVKMAGGGTYASDTNYQPNALMTADKRVFATGRYPYGDGDSATSTEWREWLKPSQASFEDIDCAGYSSANHILVLNGDAVVYAAGRNSSGQLGLGHTSHSAVPQRVRF